MRDTTIPMPLRADFLPHPAAKPSAVAAQSSAMPASEKPAPSTAAPSATYSPPASYAASEKARLEKLELELAAADHLSRLNGALELQAAILALLLPALSKRCEKAWHEETSTTTNAALVLEHARHLSGPARLTWLETLVTRMRSQSLDARQTLLESTRRVMGARRSVRPIDRLHWFAMRQWLGEGTAARARAPAASDITQLPPGEISAIATYTAFLSRLIPIDTSRSRGPDGKPPSTTEGLAWYDAVMSPWQTAQGIEPCRPPDTDGLVHSLQVLQGMAWMQRPMIVRGWVTAAQQHSPHGRLSFVAADALRLSCVLLDSPMPPELARLYGSPFAAQSKR